MIVPVVLAGGTGSRLWPLSRSAYPKQLLSLVSGHTMLQDTVMRCQAIPSIAPPLVICNQDHRFLVAEQLKQLGIFNAEIILEPVGKNTAPAAAIAAAFLKEHYGEDTLLLILPADHVIQDTTHFVVAVEKAAENARQGLLVTFGIKPSQPEIGYGYIKTAPSPDNEVCPVLQFVEKPDQATAEAYLKSGQYYWNSGMFMFQAATFLAEMELYAPDILESCQKAVAGRARDLDFSRLDKAAFSACRSDSIDYALMEKTKNAVLVPFSAAWSDVGSWSALLEVQQTDVHQNVVQGDVITQHVKGSYLRAESRMLAVVGVTDHIVVETKDAVLVAHKSEAQAVKEIVALLKQNKRPETDLHRRVYRPWGHYETVDQGDGFQVKRITVKPGASLSLQMHHHRSEHWVIVSGTAEVTRGEETFTITENESTYIPVGIRHRLANPGKINLEIIEVQSGRYLGEDDIVRYEDVYGRLEVPETDGKS